MIITKKYRLADTWVAATSALAFAVGIAVLIGWQVRILFLKNPFSTGTAMAPNTALFFILLGLSMWLQREKGRGIRSILVEKGCAGFVLVFASLTLLEYASDSDLRIDRWFFSHRLSDWTLNAPPGRFAWDTSLAFMFLALALLLLDRKWKEQPLSEILSLAAGLIAFLGLIGYMYGVPYLYSDSRMALHTAITFVVLSTSVFFARREEGFAALLLSRDISGVIARRLVLTVVVALPVLGWLLIRAEEMGLVGREFGTVLLVCVAIAVFSALTLETARRLQRQNIDREYVEAMHLLASIIESSDDAIYTRSLDGVITSWNKGAERLYGYTAAEAIGQSATFLEPREHPDEIFDLLQRIRSGERIERHESARMCKDGHSVDVSMTISPLRDNNGKITGSSAIVRDVTERKRSTQKLAESEARFRDLVEASPDAIFVNCAGKIAFANSATLKLLGANAPEQIVGKDAYHFVHPDYLPTIKQRIETHHRRVAVTAPSVTPHPLECIYIRQDGSQVEVEAVGIPISWQGSNAIEIVARDITERKRAQQTVLEWKKRLELAEQAALSIGLWEWDIRADTLTWSDEIYRQFGYTRDSFRVLGEDFFNRLHSEDRPRVETAVQAVASGLSQTYEVQFRIIRPDGSVSWLDSRGVLANNGSPRMIGISIDITKLRRSESDYRSMVETAPYGIFRSALDGHFLVVNPALTRMLGYESESELLSLNIAHDVYRNAVERFQLVSQLIEKGYLKDVEAEWRRKDGRSITVRISAQPVFKNRGEIEAFQGFVEDVTERKSLAKQLWQSQKKEAIGRLAGGVAHDFNNVLMVVGSYAELIQQRKVNDEKVNSYAEQIHEAATRAISITRQLLAFSRQQILEPEVLDLNEVVTELTKVLPRLLGEDITVVATLEPVLHRVKVDRGQIEQILMNLAVNSRDAMPKGGSFEIKTQNIELDATDAAELSPMQAGSYIKLSVVDTGIGMNAETQLRLFEPFFTTKERGRGTGLGLATVYGIVKQSSGFIWVTSEVGCGTAFDIYLPRVLQPLTKPSKPQLPMTISNNSETILLVEDEVPLRNAICTFLQSSGYVVLVAGDGAEVMRICEQHTGAIDVILTDLVMPGVDGIEVANAVASRYPGIHIMYMSGYTEHAVELLGARVVLLRKPFGLSELASKLRAALAAPLRDAQF
jgi:two-component system cell cycle sensor histidine kinase/response regulator CckA